MAAEIGIANAARAEIGIRALQVGDIAAAVGAFGAIPKDAWDELRARFPGFPAELPTHWAPTLTAEQPIAALEANTGAHHE